MNIINQNNSTKLDKFLYKMYNKSKKKKVIFFLFKFRFYNKKKEVNERKIMHLTRAYLIEKRYIEYSKTSKRCQTKKKVLSN